MAGPAAGTRRGRALPATGSPRRPDRARPASRTPRPTATSALRRTPTTPAPGNASARRTVAVVPAVALIPTARRTVECSPSAATNHFARTPAAVTPCASCSTLVTLRRDPFGVLLFGPRGQRGVQRGASHAAARPAAKPRLGPAMFARHRRCPRNGMPAGSTPSDISSARPPGISPSPHALSMGSSRGLGHDHRKSLPASV